MQNTDHGHWPKASITRVSFHSTLTQESFHEFIMDDATAERVFEAMLAKLKAEKVPSPESDDNVQVYIVGTAFRTFIGADEDGWPYAIVFGTDIEGVEYPMILLRFTSEGIWFRTIQHRFFLNRVYPAQCSLVLYQDMLARAYAAYGMGRPEI